VKNLSIPAPSPAPASAPAAAPKRRFWQLNTFIVLAICCNAINLIYDLFDRMKYSSLIELAGILMLCFFMVLHRYGRLVLPKVLSIIGTNLQIFFLCYVQGTSQASYLYLFPFAMAMIFFLRVRKTNMVVFFSLGATLLMLTSIVLFLPFRATIDQVTDSVNYHHLAVNIMVNFLLVIVFFYFILRLLDIKEQKTKIAAAAKARFMSNMSHELRTPLNAIIGTTHLLMQEHEGLQDQHHFKVLRSSSEHMLQLVNAVLDFSKLDEGKLEFVREPFDLADALQQVADSFTTIAHQKNIRLILDVDPVPDDKKVVGDEMRLKQIILNLLSNAMKFTGSGAVTIQTRIGHPTATEADIYFAVSDTGIGIPPDKLQLIFESFTQVDAETTRKYGGSGLGLTICRELVRNMGGQLKVTSQPEKGSTFYFTLRLNMQPQTDIARLGSGPVTTPLPSHPGISASHPPSGVSTSPPPFGVSTSRPSGVPNKDRLRELKELTGVHILLVEDNAVNLNIARRFLHSWGAIIQPAENGEVAWELFRSRSFDLLLVDLEMPLMDGKALITKVRSVDKDVPAIAFTAAVYENMYQDLKDHGFNGFLHKPFRPDEMHSKILQHLANF
jgi:signal transduction histidine kinase/CheY-like chemotaxis protein